MILPHGFREVPCLAPRRRTPGAHYVVQLTPLGERGQQVMVLSEAMAQVCLPSIATEL